MATAALVGGWWQGHRNTPGPMLHGSQSLSVTYPTTDLAIRVYIAPGADPGADPVGNFGWVDITQYVLWASRIIITRGRPDEQSQTPPSSCSLTLKNFAIPPYNVAGIFNPRNPNSPWFGQLGRNTPLKVEIDPGTGPDIRFIGFVPSWPPRSDVTGRLKVVTIRAEGVLRRLGQNSAPIKSAMRYRVDYFAANFGRITGYWPLEDGANATQPASGLSNGLPAIPVGTVTFAGGAPAAGAAAAPNLSGGSITAVCNPTTHTDWCIQVAFNAGNACQPLSWTTTGSITGYTLDITSTTLTVSTSAGVAVTVSCTPTDSAWHLATILGLDTGGGLTFISAEIDSADGSTASSSGLVAGTPGAVTTVTLNPLKSTDVASMSFPVVGDQSSGVLASTSLFGDVGDTSTVRFQFIGTSNGVTTSLLGFPDTTVDDVLAAETMGAQPVDQLLNVLRDCVDADEGFLVERRKTGRLGMDSHSARENRAVSLTLDNSLNQLSPDFTPVDDDQRVRNDVTVTRRSGSTTGISQRAVDTTGPLRTTKIGTIDLPLNRNLELDSQVIQHANYNLVHGTVDESRYPSVRVNFARRQASTLIPDWLNCDIGSRVKILHPPVDQPPDDIDQVIEGYVESFDQKVWDIELQLTPFSPFRIFRVTETSNDADEFIGYLIPDTWTLAADIASAGASTFSSTASPLLSTSSDDWFGNRAVIRIDGEKMIITGVSGSGNPQTVSVTRGALGTTATTHSSGATVEFATPGVLGL